MAEMSEDRLAMFEEHIANLMAMGLWTSTIAGLREVLRETRRARSENDTLRRALNEIQRLPTGAEGRGPLIAQAALTIAAGH